MFKCLANLIQIIKQLDHLLPSFITGNQTLDHDSVRRQEQDSYSGSCLYPRTYEDEAGKFLV